MTDILDWTHPVSEVGEQGLDVRREATSAQCLAVAAAMEIVACNRLVAAYRITPLPNGRFRVAGEVNAEVVQSCVVTLDPVVQRIVEPIDVEFRPKAQIDSPADGEHEVFAPDDPEPIENNRLSVGRIVYETVATALDPYPRASAAVLEDAEGQAAPRESKANPFAALADWKPKRQ